MTMQSFVDRTPASERADAEDFSTMGPPFLYEFFKIVLFYKNNDVFGHFGPLSVIFDQKLALKLH